MTISKEFFIVKYTPTLVSSLWHKHDVTIVIQACKNKWEQKMPLAFLKRK